MSLLKSNQITGKYDTNTHNAVKAFQAKYKIVTIKSGIGLVGSTTRLKLNEIAAQNANTCVQKDSSKIALLKAKILEIQQLILKLLQQLVALRIDSR